MPVEMPINDLPEALAEKVHNFASDALMIALSNTAPSAESSNPTSSGNGLLANVTQIPYTNYSDDMTVARRLEGISSDETGGEYTLDASAIVITADGGAPPTWRYLYIYNDTASGKPLIHCIDFEVETSLGDGDSVTIRWEADGIVVLGPLI